MAKAPPGRRYEGPVFDVHTHPMLEQTPLFGVPHSAADYLSAAAGLDVRHVGALVMAPRGDLKKTRRQNDLVLALAASSKGRFLALGSVHPADGAAALTEVDRLAGGGARGLKLHPNTQEFDVADPAVRAVVARAAIHGLPVLFDAYSPFDPAQPGKFVRLAMEVPESRLILAHAHGPAFPQLLVYEVLARYPWWNRNVWVDISATGPLLSGGPFSEQFVWVLRKVGVERVLFGSDFPLDDPARAVAAVAGLGFTDAELSRIFYENAMELFRPDHPRRRPVGVRGAPAAAGHPVRRTASRKRPSRLSRAS